MVFVAETANVTYPHVGLAANTTYLYRVRAIGAGGESAFSDLDPATTIIFTNDPLVMHSTTLRAAHVTQLRTAVNAMRAAAGLTAQAWTDPTVTAGSNSRAVHFTQLRTALAEAREALDLPPVVHAEAITAGTTVMATHVTELRNGVK